MSDWQEVTLGEICNIEIGGTPSRSEERYWWKSDDDGIRLPWVSISDMKGKVISDTKESITEIGALRSNCKHVSQGTLLMSFKLTIGRLAFAGRDLYTNEAISAIRPVKDVCPEFLYYGLRHWNLTGDSDQAVKGVTLNKQKLQEIPCLLPPLPEQKKIAEILSGIDKMINGISEAIEKSETILTGIFADLDLIASSGKTTKLGRVAGVQNGYAFQSSVFTEDPLGIPLIRISNISGGMVDASKSKKIPRTQVPSDEYKVTKGDILIAMSGATTGKIGRYQGDTLCLLNQRVGKFVFHPGDSGAAYVSQLLLSGFLESRILAKAAGGAQPNISGKGIEDIEIPFPDAAEQSRYGNTIHELLRINSARKDLVEKYQHLKSATSADLLSGRKRVSV
jgi:type I restriction enzyme S subunit